MEEEIPVDHLIVLSSLKHEYEVTRSEDLKSQILAIVVQHNMLGYYEWICGQLGWSVDSSMQQKLRAYVDDQLKTLEVKIADAEENLGEIEVRDAIRAKAEFYASIGDLDNALSWSRQTAEKTVGKGQLLDLVFTQIRLGLSFGDMDLVKRNVEKGKTYAEEGGDWERKNRLKVYEGVYLMNTRNFKKAATLFLDSIATFSSYELMDYKEFIKYTILTTVLTLDRPALKKNVIDASEVLTVIGKFPALKAFMRSLYDCKYHAFFASLPDILDLIKLDRYMAPHLNYYSREIRILAYSQFLESYRSVTLESMARIFGVSVTFIDRELSRFVAAGRLNCKIDKVGGIVETNRPDSKNALYQAVIKQGDLLLNRVQKLSRVVEL